MKRIAFTAKKQAGVIDSPDFSAPLQPNEVRGRTLVSLVSPGTELNWGYLAEKFPVHPGYASIFQVEEKGADVNDLEIGSIVFGSGNHAARQQAERAHVLSLPGGLSPEIAVFARLAGVSMSSLNVTVVRPPAGVLVTGLGPVGILAAQVFHAAGYDVVAIDPVEQRRNTAAHLGLKDLRGKVSLEDLSNKVGLHIECSGHEQAVLDGARVVRRGGEIYLVGVPWRKRTEITAQELLHAIFHRYVNVRSGWEWQVPVERRDFSANSIMDNLAAALRWLVDGRLRVDGLAGLYAPAQAQEVYAGLLDQSLPTPTAIFDWRQTN